MPPGYITLQNTHDTNKVNNDDNKSTIPNNS